MVSASLSLCESHNHGHARTLTDHGLDATNVGWPYDGLTPVDAQEHRCTASPLQKKVAASRLIAPTAQ